MIETSRTVRPMASDTSRPTDGSTATGTPEAGEASGSVATDRATTTTGSTGTDTAPTGTASTDAASTDAASTDTASTDAPADSATTGTATGTTSTPGTATTSGGGLAGAGAVVAAGLGLASLTGTSVGDMLRERESLVGQIQAATGSPGDTIESFYGAPWDVAAVVNGVVALVAVLVGLVLVLGPAARPDAGAWARPVALGGLVLGVLGLLVSGGMYLDLFASTPVLPQMPGIPGLGG